MARAAITKNPHNSVVHPAVLPVEDPGDLGVGVVGGRRRIRSAVSSSVRSRRGGVRLMGMASSVIARLSSAGPGQRARNRGRGARRCSPCPAGCAAAACGPYRWWTARPDGLQVVAEGQDRGALGAGERGGRRPGGGPARLQAASVRAFSQAASGRGRPARFPGRRPGSGARPWRPGSGPARRGAGAGPGPRRGLARSARRLAGRPAAPPAPARPGTRGARRVDGHAACAQVPGAAAFDHVAGAGAVVAGGGLVLALVVDGELAAAGPAGGQALQQGAALADRAGPG